MRQQSKNGWTWRRGSPPALGGNDDLLRRALGGDEVPEALRARVEATLAPPTRAGARVRPAAWRAIAASMAALGLGLGIGYFVATERFDARLDRLETARLEDGKAIEAAVNRVLEKRLSGETVHWRSPTTGSEARITPVRTFRSESGQWCREFVREVSSAAGREVVRAIACREGPESWRPKLWRYGEGRS